MPPATSYSIPRVDLEQCMDKHFSCLIVAPRGSGKSVLTADIIRHAHSKGIRRIAVFCATEGVNGFYSKYIPKLFIYNELTPEHLERIVEDQKDAIMHRQIQGKSTDNLRLLIVMDDVAYDKKGLSAKALREIAVNGRHFLISFVLCTQYVTAVPPIIRSNFDFIFALRDQVQSNVDKLHDLYGIIPTRADFRRVFSSATEDYRVFAKIRSGLYFYRVDMSKLNGFKFGDRRLWAYAQQHFLSDQEKFIRKQTERQEERHGDRLQLN